MASSREEQRRTRELFQKGPTRMLIATENGFQAIRQAVEERPDFRDFGLSTPVDLHFARHTSGARPDCAKQIIGAKREILDCALLVRCRIRAARSLRR
jgi:hypothetical protein